jgi:hypothetical protein
VKENGIVFDADTKGRFVSDLMTIARHYFGHPSYLRIDGDRHGRSCLAPGRQATQSSHEKAFLLP